MNWEDLRCFLTLVKAGSLSEAARQLGVDHTTVARRVAALEASLGLKLIDRLPRAVSVTPEGRHIAELGNRLEEGALAILRTVGAQDPAPGGLVRVSAPPAFAGVVLAPAFALLRRRYPGIVVDLVGDANNADLDRRQADIALRLSRPVGEGLVARKIGEMPYALYARAGYADERAESEWEFLAHDDLPTTQPQQRWMDAITAGRPIVFQSNDARSLASAARMGMGVALLPLFLSEGEPALVKLPSRQPPPCRDIWMVVHDDLRRTPRIRAVMDFLVELGDRRALHS